MVLNILQFKLSVPSCVLDEIFEYFAFLVSTGIVSLPLVQTDIAQVRLFTMRTGDSVRLEIEFEDSVLTLRASFAVLFNPILTQTCFQLLSLLFIKEASSLTILKIPSSIAFVSSLLIAVITPYIIFLILNQSSNFISHTSLADIVSTCHFHHAFFKAVGILSFIIDEYSTALRDYEWLI